MNPNIAIKANLVTGSILVIVCALFAGIFERIFTAILHNILIISKDSVIFQTYVAPDFPVYTDFYLFNVTNPVDVQTKGAIPELNEVGPYRYLEVLRKRDLEFSDDGKALSYYQDRTFHFMPHMSVGTENDRITTLNVIMVVLASRIATLNPAIKAMAEIIFKRFKIADDLFMTRTVSELLYEGYYDPLVEFLGKLTGDPKMADGKFGFTYKTNGTDNGRYKVSTGKNEMNDYLHILEWQNHPNLDYWGTSECNMINGTDGTQFAPGITKDYTLYLYSPDLCRSSYFRYKENIMNEKVNAYRFTLPEIAMKPKACYCSDKFSCRDTLINIRSCRNGAPIIMSMPHFYMGNKKDVSDFKGLNPTEELHETYIDVEPTTGLVVQAAKKLQVNIPLRRYADLPAFRNVRENIFPIFWVSENFRLPKKEADLLHKALTIPFIAVHCICGVLILIGFCLIFLGLVRKARIKSEPKFGKLLKK